MNLPKTYHPQKVEEKIYRFWEKGGFFTPRIVKGKQPFTITLPPPNVTGGLHAGHAMYTVEDILARYHRMAGEPTLFLPGFDHASIAVEYLITKELLREGKTKKEIGRQEFLKRARKFAKDSKNYIRTQLKKLGYSLDWSREAYTLDRVRSRAVKEAFRRLYKKGLIYQGDYLVNWCSGCQTAISDLENIRREEKGKLYYIKYGPITIATTRPETIFADVAVAINPQSRKYQKWVGQKIPLPLTNRQIPVITDKSVDSKFGSGALKITPAHDPQDFEIGRRHKLPMNLSAVDLHGRLTRLTGKYVGLSVKEAREQIVNDLKKQNLLEKIEPHISSVGHCERCDTVTEKLISKQWFIKMKPLAQKALRAVNAGQIKIIPQRFEKVYFHWLENIQDWCISRQLYWGHKIPLKNVEDTLDTWLSSSLWPISVLGWPRKTRDFKYFYPTTVRETGYDILFFWVAKEIMICLEMTGEIPFKVVYLHGLVRDEKGRKFSKSQGIGFDPLEIIQKYGADALRMGLIVNNPPGNDPKIGMEKFIAYRNFSNKLWNIGRFILGNLEKKDASGYASFSNSFNQLSEEDQKITKDLNRIIKKTTNLIERYRFDLAAGKLYHFVWHRFADQYLEYSKERVKKGDKVALAVLSDVYLTCLKLLHPFMPFITEEIWQKFPRKTKEPLIISAWPKS